MRRPSVFKRGREAICLISVTAVASLAFASPASAIPPTPPFTQCPAVGFDTSCGILLVINAHGGLEKYSDPTQKPYDGADDYLIGIVNHSGSVVSSVTLKGNDDLFGFDGDGLCSGVNEDEEEPEGFAPPPLGCPFGRTGYEGPHTSFSNYTEPDPEENADEGTVNFLEGRLQSGESEYFSLEAAPMLSCQETACEPTALSTELSGGSQSGSMITVSDETGVTDKATLSGENASIATGEVSYKVYSDSRCTELVTEAGHGSVTEGNVPASRPETLSPGTYYWQATYSGDSHNGSSTSTCGSEVDTVESAVHCSKVSGTAHGTFGAERLGSDNNLNTSLAGQQVFGFSWGGGHKLHLTHLNSASCVVQNGEKKFSGQGEAVSLRPTKNVAYDISFSITIAATGHTYISILIEQDHVVVWDFVEALMKKDHEHIS